ncbi:hypothetical protein [Asanoa iriomotensis]|uniref:MYXO-CTERM domain-containing protein n=1 Tax=Asanoa iriomotensis TaxID=234613 RepID=A0ABQ4BVV0_9ACTN|nr:hypothetical protein [Asanoa iriomotensis]GIF54281.1 hypothetical protein Air01nite_03760 [Asanoa iriomotensis]
MSKKLVGKVLASLALGGVTLLIAPGVAMAADPSDAAQWAGKDDKAAHCEKPEWDGKKDSEWSGKKEEAAPMDSAKKDEGGKKDDEKKDDCKPPKGWVDGGVAGVSTDGTMAATGGVLVGAAALGGLVLLRRRRTDGSVA